MPQDENMEKHENEARYRRGYVTLSCLKKKLSCLKKKHEGNPEDGKPDEYTLCHLNKPLARWAGDQGIAKQ